MKTPEQKLKKILSDIKEGSGEKNNLVSSEVLVDKLTQALFDSLKREEKLERIIQRKAELHKQ